MLEFLGLLWNEAIIRPMINSLVVLYIVLFNNFGLSIIVFTLIINTLTFPLTIRSIRQTRAMSAVGPRLQELKERYKDDRQRVSQETLRLYRENGINPIGCLGPLIIQMPILLGLYWAVMKTLPAAPEQLAELSGLLYSWLPATNTVLPLDSRFVVVDLALSGSAHGFVGYIIMVLVGISMWISMKMTTPMTSGTGTQQQTQQMMQWMFPVMIGFFSLSFPVGLSLYWIASSFIRALIQVVVTKKEPLPSTRATSSDQATPDGPVKEREDDGFNRSRSKDHRRGDRTRSQAARRRARRGRDRGH